ncbi:hypothetical protein [Ramlibacter albus]|uniref:Uncharacterized protein n=1 Tax=Ramlibacter albus TaxID=2079448 RepID=A0A923S4T6_9BURK|nr:hypothetical protein [Ramlibacter albus]MBC5767811.1 hypothetical protein [Ramlibacter albus]
MPDLRLGVYQLPQAEARLVRALVALLSADSPQQGWAYVENGPYDAVLVDSQFADEPQVKELAPAILTVAPVGAVDADDTLPRPIRAERLGRWLRTAEQRLGRAEATQTVGMPAFGSPGRTTRYRLRRWPPAESVHNDPARVRMATMLSRKTLSIEELSEASRLPPEKCLSFVQTLRSLGLLTVQEGGAPAPTRSEARAQAVRPNEAAPDARRTLVQSFRRRLGI